MRRIASLALGAALLTLACGSRPSLPDLVLVTLDTTRADHLGCYGYGRPTSPNLDRLAQDGVVYERAYSTSSWTLPAHASLFTGRFPSSHAARFDEAGPVNLGDAIRGGADLAEHRARGLSPHERTLASLLAERGLATGAVVAGPWLERIFSLDRGFQHYDDGGIDDVGGRRAADVGDAALAWLDRRADEPFFLFVNFFDPHWPYDDPDERVREFLPPGRQWPAARREKSPAMKAARYDGEIRYMDEHLGRLLDWLRETGRYDDAWIVVTADHGELLGEQGLYGHGKTLFEPEIRIPLVVKFPAAHERRGRSDEPIQLTDLFVMLLEGYGIGLPDGVGTPSAAGAVFTQVRPYSRGGGGVLGEWTGWIEDGHKLQWNTRGWQLLFDLENDPLERDNLAERDPERLAAMKLASERFAAELPPPLTPGQARSIDAETRRALESLGYLEDAGEGQ